MKVGIGMIGAGQHRLTQLSLGRRPLILFQCLTTAGKIRLPGGFVGIGDHLIVSGSERRRVSQINRDGGQYYVHTLVAKGLNSIPDIGCVMTVDGIEPWIILWHGVSREHLHSSPTERLFFVYLG